MRVGGYMQVDGRFFLHCNEGISTFLIRRARLHLVGTIQEIFGYNLTARWDLQTPALHHAWIETLKPSSFRIRGA